tara:strand:- start:131 stop:331 length:201 start_codon:yes stop_codon:yes gene_type:complete
MKLIITTISQAKVAIVETDSLADEKKGERYLSEDTLTANIENGNFTDITDTGANQEGRLYMLTSDM